MTYQVIGFEGSWRPEHPISWGSAALWDGKSVTNMGSGLGRPGLEAWEEYKQDGVVTSFYHPIDIPEASLKEGARVLALRHRPGSLGFVGPGLDMFAPTRFLVQSIQDGYMAIVYPDNESFDLDMRDHVKKICQFFDSIVSTSLVLTAHNLELNALRTTLRFLMSENHEMIKPLGRAILRGSVDLRDFDEIFESNEGGVV